MSDTAAQTCSAGALIVVATRMFIFRFQTLFRLVALVGVQGAV
jgi:hypothetical protein